MQDEQKPLPFSQYQTRMAGFRPVGTKYRGFIGCSMTGLASDPTYHEFICDTLCDTPAAAMHAAADLFHKLATEGGEE